MENGLSTRRKAFELESLKTGRIKAFGTLAFPAIYEAVGRRERPRRQFIIERCHRGSIWVTAEKGLQRMDLEAAENFCRALPQYRLAFLTAGGTYEPRGQSQRISKGRARKRRR